jgi:hypothetical protein
MSSVGRFLAFGETASPRGRGPRERSEALRASLPDDLALVTGGELA